LLASIILFPFIFIAEVFYAILDIVEIYLQSVKYAMFKKRKK